MKTNYLLVILLSSALRASVASHATFTLPEALHYGLTHNPAARKAQLEIDIARTQIGQAGALALPQLSLEARYTRLDEVDEVNLGDTTFDLGSPDNYEVSAQVSQLIYSGGQVSAAWRAARIAREYASTTLDAFEANLIYEISRAYYGVLLAYESVQVQQASLDTLQQFEQQARDKKASGAASEFDALTASVRVANAKPEWIAAKNQLDIAKATLANLIYFDGPLVVKGDFETADTAWTLPQLEAKAREQREQLQAARLLAALSREAVASARSEARPEIRLFANQTGGNATQFDLSDDWEWRWTAGVSARWNLWDGNLTRQTVRQREIEKRQQEYQIREIESAVLLEVKQAWLALQQAKEALAASAESVALAERALQIAHTRYDSGLSTYIELTDANLALRTAELTRLQAKHDYAVARARIRFATGIPSPHLAHERPAHNE